MLLRDLRRDLSAQAVATGVLASVLGYAGAVAVVITGLRAAGASRDEITSGLVALGILMGISSVGLSARYRLPVAVVWSTPGVALLANVGRLDGGFPVVVGAMLLAAGLIVLTGSLRPLTRLVARLPSALTAAVLAGVLLPFCLQPARGVSDLPLQAGAIALTWLVLSRLAPRWSGPGALAALVLVVLVRGDLPSSAAGLPTLALITPQLSWAAVLQVALPVYLVTMAGQNLVGIAVLQTQGFAPPIGSLLVGTGAAAALAAPFGAPTLNLAAITGALTAGEQAHPDPSRRWIASSVAGLTSFLLAGLAPITAGIVTRVDPRLVGTAAGLALLGALATALAHAVKDEDTRTAALLTLLTTASGITAAPALGLAVGVVFISLSGISQRKRQEPGG